MADETLTQLLAKPIRLADQVIKTATGSTTLKSECADLKSKSTTLVNLLIQAARSSSDLYEHPTKRIVDDILQVLFKALTIATKCRSNCIIRVFSINQSDALRKVLILLDNCIGDVSWLLRVSAPVVDRGELGLPPIAANEPVLGLIWELIAVLRTGSAEERSDAAGSLSSLARDNDHYGKLIVMEGGVVHLLKLVKDGNVEGQENAVRTIGWLGKDVENVEMMIGAGVCMVFTKMLKEGCMKAQAAVAWAIAELAGCYPKCQELFGQSVIRLLVSHLAFEIVEEHSKYAIVRNTAPSIHYLVMASNSSGEDNVRSRVVHPGESNQIPNNMYNVVSSTMTLKSEKQVDRGQTSGISSNVNQQKYSYFPGSSGAYTSRECEDPVTKSYMKAMAARALCQLVKDNVPMCRSITESRALLCFAALLNKGSEEVQYNSALTLMEITAVAEKDTELRRSAFRPNATSCKAVVDQLLNIINKGDSVLLIPCIQAIGNLARTFRASETRVISPLVKLFDCYDDNISLESVTALTKFCCTANHLHTDHSNAVIAAGASKHLIQLVYFGSQAVQIPALILLCYIASHAPEHEELVKNEVLINLEKMEKLKNSNPSHNEILENLLPLAKTNLELYQSRGIH